MKLNALYPSANTVSIKDALGDETTVKLNLVGPDSKQYHEATKKAYTEIQDKGLNIKDPDVSFRLDGAILAACITGWSGLEDENDVALAHSQEKALELMLTPELAFMREQVQAAVAERAKFFRKRNPEA